MRDSSADAYAEALNVAFGEIVTELARDLAAVQLPKRQASRDGPRLQVMRVG
jgi:hypothetical protein